MSIEEVIVLPSGTEITGEAALSDLRRIQYVLSESEALTGIDFSSELCDLKHIEELLRSFYE